MVAAVVGTGGDLVDDDFAIGGDEHFDGHGADVVEAFGDGLPEGDGLLGDFGIDAGGGDGDIEDVVGVLVFDAAVGGHGAIDAAGTDDGDFADEGDPLLDDGALAGEAAPGFGEVGLCGDFALAFAVVTEGGGFDDAGAAELCDGGFEAGEVIDDAEGGAGDALIAQEVFFALAMLGGDEGPGSGAQGLHGLDGGEA